MESISSNKTKAQVRKKNSIGKQALSLLITQICKKFSYVISSLKVSIIFNLLLFSSVHFSRSVVSDFLQPHGLQHARPLCPSPTPRVYPNSCPLSHWCHPIISSSVVPFSCPQSFPAAGCFQMSQFLSSGGQSIGVSASITVFPVNIQDWFTLG